MATKISKPCDIYFVANCTTAFLTIQYSLSLLNKKIISSTEDHYLKFTSRITFQENVSDSELNFITHLSPITGNHVELAKQPGIRIVDGAQTFGTILEEELFNESDIWFAPLHKHCDIISGIAVVVITKKEANVVFDRLNDNFSFVDNGSLNLSLYQEVVNKILDGKNKINNCRLNITQEIIEFANRHNLCLLTNPLDTYHIISFKPILSNISQLVYPNRLRGKIFKDLNVIRLSYYSRTWNEITSILLFEDLKMVFISS